MDLIKHLQRDFWQKSHIVFFMFSNEINEKDHLQKMSSL